MAPVSDYPEIIKRIIKGHAAFKPSHGDVDVEAIFDDVNGHYELLYSGWFKEERIHGPVVHVDIKGDKVWIQFDGTEAGIAGELMDQGIPRDRIVLGFQSPFMRKHGDFAHG
ncbi:MAG: XisI protein [Polyangiaceae bacterium]|nr:XisI protein [Polyangiaceae bacterium]